MKIRKVVARDMQVALHMLRKELGEDAVIVSSRTIREPGIMGFFRPRKVEVTAALERVSDRSPGSSDSLQNELGEIKALLGSLNQERYLPSGPETAKWAERFKARDISGELMGLLLEQARSGGPERDVEQKILERIAQVFVAPAKPRARAKRILAFVGPTGVGKTTTIAKLAARRALQENKKIALITIDTFRIGAVEQMKIYGDIIGVPVEVVSTPAELQEAVARHRTKDTVFIDTTGRSARRPLQLAELRAFFDGIPHLEKYLVVSATTKERDLLNIYRAFSGVNLTAAIITKLDETASLGAILDLCHRTSLPVAYVANGQNVPEDIEEAKPASLARLVLGVAE